MYSKESTDFSIHGIKNTNFHLMRRQAMMVLLQALSVQ